MSPKIDHINSRKLLVKGQLDMNTSILMWGLIFGSIGLGFFVYGKKQKMLTPLICGIGLMALPYFISSVTPLVITSLALVALPFVVKR